MVLFGSHIPFICVNREVHAAQVALLLVEGGGKEESNEKDSENTHPKPTAPWLLQQAVNRPSKILCDSPNGLRASVRRQVHGKPCQPDSYEEVPADRCRPLPECFERTRSRTRGFDDDTAADQH